MGYNDDSVVKVDQEFFQPFDRREVQMVGRLVEKQDVRVSEKCLGKKNFDLLAACQVSHLCVMEFCVNAKTVQECGSIGFCFPSVHFGKFTFQFAGTDTVFVCEIFFCVDGIFFFHDLIQSLVSHDNGVENCIGVIFEVILLQERETLSGCDDNITVGRLQLSGKDLQEGRFTGTVGTDQTVAVAFCKFDIYIFKERFFTHAQSNVVC